MGTTFTPFGFSGCLYALELLVLGLVYFFILFYVENWYLDSIWAFCLQKRRLPVFCAFWKRVKVDLELLVIKKGWKHEEFKFGKLKMTEKTWSPFDKPKSSETLVVSQKSWKKRIRLTLAFYSTLIFISFSVFNSLSNEKVNLMRFFQLFWLATSVSELFGL